MTCSRAKDSPPPAESPPMTMLLGLTGRWAAPSGGWIRNRSGQRMRHRWGEIRRHRKGYTHRRQGGLAERKGRGIEERVDSWVLQHGYHSTPVDPHIDILTYPALALVFCAHNAVSYTYKRRRFILCLLPNKEFLTSPDPRSRNNIHLKNNIKRATGK